MKFTELVKLFLFFVMHIGIAQAQNNTISIDKIDTSVAELLDFIELNTNYNFVYKRKLVNLNRKISIKVDNEYIYNVLNIIFQDTDVDFILKNNQIILKKKKLDNNNLYDSLFISNKKIKIKGTVLDKNNNPLIGATILEKDTKSGTVTDFDGEFTIDVLDTNAILDISYIGYLGIELKLNNRNYISVILEENNLVLDQVIIIGYGAQKKSDLTGSISSIKKEDLKNNVFTSFDQLLQGRAAGVQVVEASGEPGGYVSVNVRGTNSLSNKNEPLYILDGIPLSLDIEGENDQYWGKTNPLATLNPNNIENIEILKDASATAIYGSRASNGVILITTKSAINGLPQVQGQVQTSVVSAGIPYKLMDASHYNSARNYIVQLDNPNVTYQELLDNNQIPYPNTKINGKGTDFMDAIFRTAITRNYNLSFSGGNDKFSQLLSLNFDDQEGVIIDSKFNRGNLHFNSKMKLTNFFSLNTNIQLNFVRNKRVLTSTKTGLYGVVFNAMRINPNISLRDENGELTKLDTNGDFLSNPYTNAVYDDNVLKNKDIIAGVSSVFKISDDLIFNTRFGLNHRISNNVSFAYKSSTLGMANNGRMSNGNAQRTAATLESFLNYEKKIENHQFIGLLGLAYENFITSNNFNLYTDFTFDELGPNAIQLANNAATYRSRKTKYNIQSSFFRLDYNYKNKYLFNLNGRLDGTSKFTNGNPWGFFPSMAVSWVVKKESFLKNVELFNQLKLRASYGKTGSQFGVDPLSTQDIYEIDKIPLSGSTQYTATFATKIANKNLTWETSKTFNLGIDFGLFANKINGSIDLYKRKTDRLLTQLQIPSQTGFNTIPVNAGALNNEGIELELDFTVIQNENFNWSSKINWTTNKSKILNLGLNNYIESPSLSANFFAISGSRNFPGNEIGLFYGYNIIGLIQKNDLVDYENGDFNIKTVPGLDNQGNSIQVPLYPTLGNSSNNRLGTWIFEDVNKDGVINIDDRKIIGNPNPDFFFGWNNNFTISNFDISLFLQGSYGNDILNLNKAFTGIGWGGGNSTEEWFRKRWTLYNQHNDVSWPSSQIENAVSTPNSVYVEDGSYIRLKNLSIRYNIPSKTGTSKIGVSLTGTNLITITNYTGIDPEVDSYGGDPLLKGVDFSAYARPKIYSLGLNFDF